MRQRVYTALSHLATWGVLFLLPMTFRRLEYPMLLIPTAVVIAVFYVNYVWVAPYYMKGHRAVCWVFNAILVSVLSIALYFWLDIKPGYLYFNLAVAVMIAITSQIAKQWQQSEEARLKAERARADAELSNLRYQTNPHFLLNTLNNIYALTNFDTRRAQDAIQQLSGMLRHILYDNQDPEVSIDSEVTFLQNYVKLMKIRLPVTVDVTFDCEQVKGDPKIAPLILIPLVENAFKHGVSMTKPSFIHIRLTADDDQIDFNIRNSSYQKNDYDQSGHGIGLEQVRRRLELAYQGRYTWQYGLTDDRKEYSSHIHIALT